MLPDSVTLVLLAAALILLAVGTAVASIAIGVALALAVANEFLVASSGARSTTVVNNIVDGPSS